MKNVKNKIKNINGITLIVLVITVIILLILAGITINALTNSGIFEKAKEARNKWQNAQENEETQIAKYSNEIDSYVVGSREFFTETELYNAKTITTGKIELSDNYKNYKQIVFVFGNVAESGESCDIIERTFLVSTLNFLKTNNKNIFLSWYDTDYIRLTITDDDEFNCSKVSGYTALYKIIGLK